MRYRKNKGKEAIQNMALVLIPMSISMVGIPMLTHAVSGWSFGLTFVITAPFVMLAFYGLHKFMIQD